ncbi:hypothetical protein [Streptomyces sp. NRRL F-2799]|uniref:hypothetical protein n=1 Tax=Streptomyces sp. NRRL F-2799 TaxID=1463844 RepID=UPI0004C9CAA6
MSAPGKGGDARRRLAAPTLAMLPRVADSLSFLYLDMVRVVQDDTGVCAQIEAGNRTDLSVTWPDEALAAAASMARQRKALRIYRAWLSKERGTTGR